MLGFYFSLPFYGLVQIDISSLDIFSTVKFHKIFLTLFTSGAEWLFFGYFWIEQHFVKLY